MSSIKAMGLPQPFLFLQEKHFSGECICLYMTIVSHVSSRGFLSDCPLRLARRKSPRCSLDSIIYAHSGHHSLHCLTSYSWPIDGETLCASWWSLQRSLQRPYFHYKSHYETDQWKEAREKSWFSHFKVFSLLSARLGFIGCYEATYCTILEQTT